VSVALIFLHGFTNTGRSWDPVIAALGERYTALAPDIRGHGSASQRAPVTLQAVIGDLATLADGGFTLVGYSMGGRIALHVALALPERVERLVLIGACSPPSAAVLTLIRLAVERVGVPGGGDEVVLRRGRDFDDLRVEWTERLQLIPIPAGPAEGASGGRDHREPGHASRGA